VVVIVVVVVVVEAATTLILVVVVDEITLRRQDSKTHLKLSVNSPFYCYNVFL